MSPVANGQATSEVAMLTDIIEQQSAITLESLGPVQIEWKTYSLNEKTNPSSRIYCFAPFESGFVMFGKQSLNARDLRGIYTVILKNDHYTSTISGKSTAMPRKAFHVSEFSKIRFVRESVDLPETRDGSDLFRTLLFPFYFRPGQIKIADSFKQWRGRGANAKVVKQNGNTKELELDQWPTSEDETLHVVMDEVHRQLIQLRYSHGVTGFCNVLEHTNIDGVSFPSKFYCEFTHPLSTTPTCIEAQWSRIQLTDIGALPEHQYLTFYRLPEPDDATLPKRSRFGLWLVLIVMSFFIFVIVLFMRMRRR